MKKTQKQEKITLESLYAFLDESSKRSDLEYKKMQEEAKKRSKEFRLDHTEFRREMRELRESMKETDHQIKETAKTVREVTKQLGGIGNSNGDVAEEYFQNAFKKNPKLNGEIYKQVNFNVIPRPINGQKEDEYDIVLSNGKSITIIEIKYHLKKSDTKDVLSKILNKIETFKAFYPECENHKFYLGIASLSFKENVEKIIQEAGIAVIKQVGDKMVINSENLKAF
jgi:hypothetical protein